MAVSVTPVQAAVQGLSTAGAAGPLTLTVLHKTDALLSKLLAFDNSKPLHVEVLKGQPNGRAEVLVGALKLDVKSSAPLKAGDVLNLNVKEVGSAVKLVQGTEIAPSKAGVNTNQNSGLNASQNNGQNAVAGARGAVTGAPVVISRDVVQAQLSGNQQLQAGAPKALVPTPPVLQAASQATSQTASQGAAPVAGSAIAGRPVVAGSTPPPLPTTIQGAVVQGALTGGASGNAGVLGATPINTTQQAQTPLQAAALVRAVAEVLPSMAKKGISGSDAKHLQAKLAHSLGGENAGGRGAGVATASTATAGPNPAQVNASYSQVANGAIEEIQEIQGRPLGGGAEVTAEILLGDGKSAILHIQVNPDGEAHDTPDGRHSFGVAFSLETEETGPIHAELNVLGTQVRLTLWAEQEEFAGLLEANLEGLQLRLEAAGLQPGILKVRRGRPHTHMRHFQMQDEPHMDAKI